MAMFSIKGETAMSKIKTGYIGLSVILAAGIGLSACTQSEVRLSPDFGQAVRQDMAAQIADPDAHYIGTPAPGTDGARVGLAQQRYGKGEVIQPSSTTASSKGSIGQADNGAGGAGTSVGSP
jgi:hypothetical protein